MSIARISHPTKKINAHISLPGSKSESNRLLILNALSGGKINIQNLSTARDTQNLLKILSDNGQTADVVDAGTSMRFLTAYYCIINQHKLITGSGRMKERPMAPLVNALIEMGFDIRYKEKEGFAPIEIFPVKPEKTDNEAFIDGNVSSQFITALILIAPFLRNGLTINFTSSLTSRPYIDMTLNILEHLGVVHIWSENSLTIPASKGVEEGTYAVAGDWSSASYWYSIAFLSNEADIFLEGLKNDWTQGDRVVADWMRRFGVTTEFTSAGARIKKLKIDYPRLMKLNFIDNPDLAQGFAVMFGAANIFATFSGIDSLKIKETDRIAALQRELKKMNVSFIYSDMYEFYQLKGAFQLPVEPVKTYNDHRMAMSFAPLALLGEIEIENPEVVEKSYPGFWSDMEKAGFKVTLQ